MVSIHYPSVFIHIDMDYFFAQLEEKRHPEYQGRVVVVCVYSGRTADSGAVSTVNYKGREYGIRSGMPIAFAKKRAPQDAVFLPVDREYYAIASASIDDLIRKNTGRVIQASIDEWNIEDEKAEDKARLLKQGILSETGLTCTIAVAPSLLGAKMGASSAKPDGLLILDEKAERKLISESETEKVPGIGPKTSEALRLMGIVRVGDLEDADPITLVEAFGKKTGSWLHALGQGSYAHGLGEEKEQDEVSRIGTLKHTTREVSAILDKLDELEADAKEWLMHMKKSYNTLTIIFITEDLRTHTKSLSFSHPRPWNADISKEKEQLVLEFLRENKLSLRRVGIRFSNFIDMEGQATLF